MKILAITLAAGALLASTAVRAEDSILDLPGHVVGDVLGTGHPQPHHRRHHQEYQHVQPRHDGHHYVEPHHDYDDDDHD